MGERSARLAQRGMVGGDHRRALHQGLEHRNAETLGESGKGERARLAIVKRHVLVIDILQMHDAWRGLEIGHDVARPEIRLADDDQLDVPGVHTLIRAQQRADVLAGLEPTDGQDIRLQLRRQRPAGWHSMPGRIDPRIYQPDLFRRQAIDPHQILSRRLRQCKHDGSMAGTVPDQQSVANCRGGGEELRVRLEQDVVDCNHLARRVQQRRHILDQQKVDSLAH